jgi:iron-sulfur cluster assembly protein
MQRWGHQSPSLGAENALFSSVVLGYHFVCNAHGGADLAIEQTPTTTATPLVSLTAKATDKLREVLAKQERQDLALRVYVTPGGCSGFSYGMTFADGTEEDDAVVEQDGVRVVVDPMSAMYLKGSEIDFVDALMGGGFALRNPNAVSSCGCGQSFRTADQHGTAKACAH